MIKEFLAFVIVAAIALGLVILVLHSGNVKTAGYHHCMVTSTTKTECEEWLK